MYFIHLLQKLKLPGLRRRLRLQLLVALHDIRDHLLLPLDVGPQLWLLVRNEVLIIVIDFVRKLRSSQLSTTPISGTRLVGRHSFAILAMVPSGP